MKDVAYETILAACDEGFKQREGVFEPFTYSLPTGLKFGTISGKQGPPGMKDRIEPRHKVLMRGKLHGSGFARDVCVLDASSRGLLLTLAIPPARGEMIDVMVNGHTLFGQVEWSNGRRMGLRFRERIDVLAFISGESGPLALSRARPSLRSGTLVSYVDWNRFLANRMQFAVAIGLVAIGGWFLFDLVRASVGSLDRIGEYLSR